jgi:hypothetical protein
MNDLDQLQEDLRATAPQPRPEFAARLERRVEAGFKAAKPARAPRRRVNLWGPAVALACTALIAIVAALGSVERGSDEEGGSMGSEAPAAQSMDEQESGGGGGEASSAAAPEPAPPAVLDDSRSAQFARERSRGRDGDRVVEQRTSLDLETNADDFAEVSDGVLRVADDSGSIVQSSNVSEEGGRGYARYDLRVPASRLDETMRDLSRLAHVTSRTASTQDITRSYVSATDRLDDARAERASLLKALERADTDVEAEALRRQIAIVRNRIAIATRDVQALQRRADRAKVSVTVRSTGKRGDEGGGAWTPGDAIGDAGRILEVAAGVVVVTAAALAPVALLALLVALAARAVRRRRREAALGPAPAAR